MWCDGVVVLFDINIVCGVVELFLLDGGLCVFDGNIGCLVIKVLVVKLEYCFVEVLVCVFFV